MALSKRTQSNQVLVLEWRNPLLYRPLCRQKLLSNTFNEQHFDNIIKVPYLGKLSVMYDTENVGLSHFSSNENKGLQSIAEIHCSVI